jgi:YD repeat-containing protein
MLRQAGSTKTVQRVVYGEDLPDGESTNVRGRVWRTDDGAGTVTYSYDVKGNLTQTTRALATAYRDVIDWSADPAIDAFLASGSVVFDALNRPCKQNHPDGTVVRFAYNAAGQVCEIEAILAAAGSSMLLVTNIDYDARGQRARVDYGNGITTRYTYDPETFRLATMRTLRPEGRSPRMSPHLPTLGMARRTGPIFTIRWATSLTLRIVPSRRSSTLTVLSRPAAITCTMHSIAWSERTAANTSEGATRDLPLQPRLARVTCPG